MLENYLINENTLAIIPENNNKSRIIEKYLVTSIDLKPIEIINYSCLYYGSSFIGRWESSAYYLGSKYKTPIIINESKKIILFPTESYNNKNCIWLNYNGIYKFYSNNISNKSTVIELINHKLLTLNVSNRIISNQFLKSSRLDSIYKSKNH